MTNPDHQANPAKKELIESNEGYDCRKLGTTQSCTNVNQHLNEELIDQMPSHRTIMRRIQSKRIVENKHLQPVELFEVNFAYDFKTKTTGEPSYASGSETNNPIGLIVST